MKGPVVCGAFELGQGGLLENLDAFFFDGAEERVVEVGAIIEPLGSSFSDGDAAGAGDEVEAQGADPARRRVGLGGEVFRQQTPQNRRASICDPSAAQLGSGEGRLVHDDDVVCGDTEPKEVERRRRTCGTGANDRILPELRHGPVLDRFCGRARTFFRRCDRSGVFRLRAGAMAQTSASLR